MNERSTRLSARAQTVARGLRGRMGLYIRPVGDGEAIEIEADRPFQMASVFKVPILAELMCQAHAGRRSLDERITLADAMRTPGSGVLKELSAGTALTIRDLATLMIIISDNTATDILLGLVGKNAVNARLRACGLTRTTVTMSCRELLSNLVGLTGAEDSEETRREVFRRLRMRRIDRDARVYRDPTANMTTPREMGGLLERVAHAASGSEGNGPLPAEAARGMLEIMRRQQVRDRLPLLLAPGVEIAHKTGSVTHVSNDAGVLYTPKGAVVAAVFTADLADELQGRLAIAEIGRAVYEAYA